MKIARVVFEICRGQTSDIDYTDMLITIIGNLPRARIPDGMDSTGGLPIDICSLYHFLSTIGLKHAKTQKNHISHITTIRMPPLSFRGSETFDF